MIDYDDMNEVLGKEEKELAEEEARRQQKIADALSRDRPTDSGRPGVYSPVFGDTSEKPAENSDSTEDETWDESKYDIYMTIYESAKNKLDLKLESARKDYDGVDRRKQNEWTDLLGVIIGFLIHTGGYPVVYTLFVLKNVTNAITLVSFTFLGLFWVFYTAKFFLKLLTEFANYRIRCSARRFSPVIEENKILTYQKERDIALEKIRALKTNLDKLENFRSRIEKKSFLSESQCQAMRELGLLSFPESRYKEVRITAGDYFRYLLHRN